MGMLRPEKSWRPIITLEVDGQHKHEVILGVDGQNPNQRDIMLLHHAHHHTQIKLDVWHKSQSKKSRKRRHLVASASMALGDAIKKQGTEAQMVFRLSSVPRIPAARRKSIAQKSEPCASLLVRLRPPQSAMPFLIEHDRLSSASSGDNDLSDTLVTSGTDDSHSECEVPTPWSSAISEEPPPGLRRRKKAKGYCINSEEERSGESDYPFSGSEAEDTKACDIWEPPIPHDKSSDIYPDSLEIRTITNAPSTISIFSSLLPTSYVSDTISVTSGMSYASSTFDTLTYHRELREAQATQLDSNFDRIHCKLVQEWYYIGASLFSIIAVDTTVFGFSSGNLFGVDSVAKRALSISSVASALGLFVDVWLIFVYSGADGRKFQVSLLPFLRIVPAHLRPVLTASRPSLWTSTARTSSSRSPRVCPSSHSSSPSSPLSSSSVQSRGSRGPQPCSSCACSRASSSAFSSSCTVSTASPLALRGWCAVSGSACFTFRAPRVRSWGVARPQP
ncbi:hypothetical protein EDB85DRAFT_856967 [Lactarius pseudohatsudake]|nr:hypothetical protein EDB85DRAFT_856967 [Lactarius pseudohatsudake]